MPQVRTDILPETSSLWFSHQPGDFIDCYSIESSLTPQEAAMRGLDLPGWVLALVALRNRLVGPLGLKTGAVSRSRTLCIFPLCKDSADEMVVGMDDRHLDFRLAVFRQEGRVYLSTWVRPHNLAGRIYLRCVLPFHIIICRGMVARMAG
jgi:hypothetical protein